MPEEKYTTYGEDARRLYVEENKSAKEIAQLLPVCEKTLSEWINGYRWKEERRKARLQTQSDEATVKQIMRKFLAELSDKQPNQITPADLDKVSKLSSTLRTIQSMLDPKAATVFVMKRFMEFVAGKNKELHQSLLTVVPEFFEIMGRQ